MTSRTDDPRDDRRSVVLDGEQRGWLLTAVGYLQDVAGRDEDPAAVFEAAKELRTIADQFDRAPAVERVLRAAVEGVEERSLSEPERQRDRVAGALYEQERRYKGWKWADIPKGSSDHACYLARAGTLLDAVTQRELPSRGDEAARANSQLDTIREPGREDLDWA